MLRLFAAAIFAGALAGCGALFNAGPAQVTFNSEPSGAEVFIDGNRYGTTPLVVDLSKKENYAITFRMDGHEEQVRTISNRVSGTYVILDILGGLLPIVIDAATGAWYVLDTNSVSVTMTETSGQLDAVQLAMVKRGVPASAIIDTIR